MSQQPDSVAVQLQSLPRHVPTVDPSPAIAHRSEGNEHVKISGNGNCFQQTFSPLPHRKAVDMQFEKIGFTLKKALPLPKLTSRFCPKEKTILHELNGIFLSRQLIAIIGPSGAGKSTLLDILSGYRIAGVTGSVMLNGQERNLNSFKRLSCYITQDDRLQPLLTVSENMKIAADLKLGEHVSTQDKNGTIREILSTLRLSEHGDTRTARLSGGQKKRLSIAMELIANPLFMFLDEPTTGLDSSSCIQCVSLLHDLARQGRTIVCTIHQPSASLFGMFDHVYLLSQGRCLYQGATKQLVPYLAHQEIPCPIHHNPADYVIELACGEYGEENIDKMVKGADNGRSTQWIMSPDAVNDSTTADETKDKPRDPDPSATEGSCYGLQETSQWNQIKVLLRRGYIKTKRDRTLTYLRIIVNIAVAFMLGTLFLGEGNEGSRVLDNYNLLFACLIHNMMTPMMITILTFPAEMSILQKEHFNRWYSLKSYYISITITDFPVMVLSCFLFALPVYLISGQPSDMARFSMFFTISLFIVYVAMSFGLLIGAIFDVVNGTFLGPTLSVPIMMFAGFGVTLRDMPSYLKWGTYISYLRYGLEGYVSAIYGYGREILDCVELYCHYRVPDTFLNEISMTGDQFWKDVIALLFILLFFRLLTYPLLKFKLRAVR